MTSRFRHQFFALASIAVVSLFAPSVQAELLVTDKENNSVLRYDENTGAFLGALIQGSATDPTLNGALVGPIGLATRPGDNHLYVVSSGWLLMQPSFSTNVSRILKYDLQSGSFVQEYATGPTLRDSFDIAFDTGGNAYVSNFGSYHWNSGSFPLVLRNSIAKFDADGNALGTLTVASGSGPTGMTIGPDGDLFASFALVGSVFDAISQVARFDGTTGNVVDLIGTSQELLLPMGLLVHDNYLYVGSWFQNRVSRFELNNPNSAEVLIDLSSVDGKPYMPGDLLIGRNGNLLVAANEGTSNGVTGVSGSGRIFEYSLGQSGVPDGTFVRVFADGTQSGLIIPGQMVFAAVPEPSTLSLLVAGIVTIGFGFLRRRHRR